jgi:hypothetical protein
MAAATFHKREDQCSLQSSLGGNANCVHPSENGSGDGFVARMVSQACHNVPVTSTVTQRGHSQLNAEAPPFNPGGRENVGGDSDRSHTDMPTTSGVRACSPHNSGAAIFVRENTPIASPQGSRGIDTPSVGEGVITVTATGNSINGLSQWCLSNDPDVVYTGGPPPTPAPSGHTNANKTPPRGHTKGDKSYAGSRGASPDPTATAPTPASPPGGDPGDAWGPRRSVPIYSVADSSKDRHLFGIYEAVRAFSRPNFLGARVPVPSGLNIEAWEQLLKTYPDRDLVQFLKFGWPINYCSEEIPWPTWNNHKSARDFPEHIKSYIDTELAAGTLMGPFPTPPFHPWSHCNPMMTAPNATPMHAAPSSTSPSHSITRSTVPSQVTRTSGNLTSSSYPRLTT